MKYLFFIFIFFSILDANPYRKGSLNIVIDKSNSLMWVDDKTVFTIYKNHENALTYCENLKHAGYSNWRIPKIKEFETVVDRNNFDNHHIYKAFKYNAPLGYWAFKAHWRTFWFYADYMHFVSGTPYFDSRHKKKNVRCVRSIN